MPQFIGSVERSRHVEVPPVDTQLSPDAHARPSEPHSQRPALQLSPELQRTGGIPQFSGMSLRRHS
jgi:hypothetical protein